MTLRNGLLFLLALLAAMTVAGCDDFNNHRGHHSAIGDDALLLAESLYVRVGELEERVDNLAAAIEDNACDIEDNTEAIEDIEAP